jgi:phosphoribosylformylglycinamidine synthase
MGYKTFAGQAMSTGERSPVALLNAPASGRMAITEAITNLACADVGDISQIRLSANWMAPCGDKGEDAKLYDTVEEVGLNFCPKIGVSIPVGKDSCSMHSVWNDPDGTERKQVSPLSLVISAFAPVKDVRLTLTPDFKPSAKGEKSRLVFVDLSKNGESPLGATALAQVYGQLGDNHADADAATLKRFFNAMQKVVGESLALAYHDRSDGGVVVTLAEMAITGGSGVKVTLPEGDALEVLFNEQPGAVLQVSEKNLKKVLDIFRAARVKAADIGEVLPQSRAFQISVGSRLSIDTDITYLRRCWSETTYRMQALRDNPVCAREEYDNALNENDPGLNYSLTYNPDDKLVAPSKDKRPKMAILREQGVNGHIEMAAAFALAGFDCVDVHMSDLISGKKDLSEFKGLVACGGFSYGDVLGAGSGWARSILFNDSLREMFRKFFHRPDTFSFGVCNGCQMLSQLKDIIPGAQHWPSFVKNVSEQFEARLAMVEIEPSPSILFKGMEGSRIPVPVAHGEGRVWTGGEKPGISAAHYVDGFGEATMRYPWNPNGSIGGQTAFTSEDGRATIMMPHPERAFRACQLSYNDGSFKKDGPWMRIFRNAYQFAVKS